MQMSNMSYISRMVAQELQCLQLMLFLTPHCFFVHQGVVKHIK